MTRPISDRNRGAVGELLTVEQAAERLNMSTRYVRRLVAERRIVFYRLGRSLRFKEADLAAFIESTRVEPMSATSVYRGLGGVA
ncbi:MAG: helix-turn-helix domain-containing protein [Carbonactinosporaceae bacterium]